MERPKIKIEKTKTDKIIEFISVIVLAFIFFITFYYLPDLPGRIAIHFNIFGKPDKYGSHYTLYLFPALSLLFYIFFTFLKSKPHIFNYPVKITEENARQAYTLAVKMLSYLQLVFFCGFLYLEYSTIQTALGSSEGIATIPFLIFLLIIIFILIYSIIRFLGINKNTDV